MKRCSKYIARSNKQALGSVKGRERKGAKVLEMRFLTVNNGAAQE